MVAYVPNRLRRIYTYNTGNVAFPYNVLPIEAYTDNIFEPLSDTSSRYTFRSYLLRFNDPVSVFLFNYSPGGRGLLEPTFNQNLNNMKAMCEALYRDQEPTVPHGFWTHRTALDRPPDKLVEAPPPDEVGPRLGRYSNCDIELREKYPLPEFNV